MIEIKEFKKGIHQLEWEKKMMIMQMEDLQTRSKYIQLLKLTKNLQDVSLIFFYRRKRIVIV